MINIGLCILLCIVLPISAYLDWRMKFKLEDGKFIEMIEENPLRQETTSTFEIESWTFGTVTYNEVVYGGSGRKISTIKKIVTKTYFFDTFKEIK